MATAPDNAKEPTEYTIRKIALSYSKLCQLIYFINDKDGAGLLWMTVYMTINVIMSMYNQVLEITNVDNRDIAAAVLPMVWLIITTTRLVLLTEQCHRIQEQMGNTRHHLSRLKCSFRDVAVSNELDLFQSLTVLRRPTFSPQDMFTLTRTFCTKVFGAVVTMVVIMVTYGKEVKGSR
ncbi:uncharacterized protein LOC121728070 [Aricia agestis]|uniref:uncharacterized protein LOC121728070 n=1 Tax=Aricia agestis TaxID=91739 RepID=UPI001C20B2DE|nr:uncharacterized protein LOC121728070 [Aricia agestis]